MDGKAMEWKPKRLTREQMEERRLAAMKLLRRKRLSQAEIGRRMGVSRVTVSNWAKAFREKGKKGLRHRRASGRPRRLSEQQQKELCALLKAGARAAGFPTERWTLLRVSQLIEETFQVSYHFRSLGALLHQLGFSAQLPQPKARERDEEVIRAWLAKDWPRIKKSAAHWKARPFP